MVVVDFLLKKLSLTSFVMIYPKKHKSQKSDFEACWLEIVGSAASENIAVGVIFINARPK